MIAIIKKEMRTYFTSMMGYVVLAFFVALSALFFSIVNVAQMYPDYSYVLGSTTIVFLIMIPILTMRLFAEEAKQKTDQLLFTAPLSTSSVVLGKYFSALLMFLTGMAITMLFPFILSFFGQLPTAQIIGAFTGYILLGAAFIGIGLFVSVLTDNQIIAAVGSFAVLFILHFLDGLATIVPSDRTSSLLFVAGLLLLFAFLVYNSTKNIFAGVIVCLAGLMAMAGIYLVNNLFFDGVIVKILGWLSLLSRFGNFNQGILDVSDIIYYITFTAAFLYLTINTIETRRWK